MPGRSTSNADARGPRRSIIQPATLGAVSPGAPWTGTPAGLSMASRKLVLDEDREVEAGGRAVVECFGDDDGEDVAFLDQVRLARRLAVDGDMAGGDQTLQARAAELRADECQNGIEPAIDRGGYSAAGRLGGSRNIAHSRKNTPIVMAESAALNAGQ